MLNKKIFFAIFSISFLVTACVSLESRPESSQLMTHDYSFSTMPPKHWDCNGRCSTYEIYKYPQKNQHIYSETDKNTKNKYDSNQGGANQQQHSAKTFSNALLNISSGDLVSVVVERLQMSCHQAACDTKHPQSTWIGITESAYIEPAFGIIEMVVIEYSSGNLDHLLETMKNLFGEPELNEISPSEFLPMGKINFNWNLPDKKITLINFYGKNIYGESLNGKFSIIERKK